MLFTEYQTKLLALFKPVIGVPAVFYYALALNEEAGEFAGKIKKLYRDHDGVLSPERRLEALKELGDTLAYVTAAAKVLDSSLEEVAQLNLDKLYDREDRSVLGGSGDNR